MKTVQLELHCISKDCMSEVFPICSHLSSLPDMTIHSSVICRRNSEREGAGLHLTSEPWLLIEAPMDSDHWRTASRNVPTLGYTVYSVTRKTHTCVFFQDVEPLDIPFSVVDVTVWSSGSCGRAVGTINSINTTIHSISIHCFYLLHWYWDYARHHRRKPYYPQHQHPLRLLHLYWDPLCCTFNASFQ
jgi:hypothetical protein